MGAWVASELERILKLARGHVSRRRLGFRDSHAVHESRLREFCATHEPRLSTLGGPHRFTVVLTCYDHARYLPSAFASIEAQTVPPSEIIVIDDRSTDDSWQVIQDLTGASGLPSEALHAMRNDRNLGQCATINAAVARATSDAIVVLNDDDYLMHDALALIERVLAAHPTAALVGARAVAVGSQAYLDNLKKSVAELVLSGDVTVRMSDPSQARAYTSARQLDMCHSGSTFLKEAWQAVGGYYPEKGRRVVLFADRDFQLRVNCLYPVALVEDAPFAFWRVGSSVDRGLFT
jgi:glycosyltransferase involved in cell wall biosynthesis